MQKNHFFSKAKIRKPLAQFIQRYNGVRPCCDPLLIDPPPPPQIGLLPVRSAAP